MQRAQKGSSAGMVIFSNTDDDTEDFGDCADPDNSKCECDACKAAQARDEKEIELFLGKPVLQ